MNQMHNNSQDSCIEGILIVDKPKGKTSFSLVADLRKSLGVKKIGHAGTLDPFATGVMVMLIGRRYTRLSDSFLTSDKEYLATVYLGKSTDTFDCDGQVTGESAIVPALQEIENALKMFEGEVEQIPPMFSAKKVNGKKLYELARKGQVVERKPVKISLHTELVSYNFPYLELRISCSKGTYIRSIANDLGIQLNCGAHLSGLIRTKSGTYHLKDSMDGSLIRHEGGLVLQRMIRPPSE
jgi:tRNA pseudouridine55 synthase